MRRSWAAAPMLVGLLAGAGCSTSADDPVVEGAGGAALRGQDVRVVVPSGEFALTVTETRSTLDAEDTADGEQREAPDDQAYVGISWTWVGSDSAAFNLLNQDVSPESTTVALADGPDAEDGTALFEMDPQTEQSGDPVWTLVPDDGSGELLVTYDGQTQRVELATGEVDAGVAEGLYDIADQSAECTEQAPIAAAPWSATIDCTVDAAIAVPYVAGLGWADTDTTWLLTQITLGWGQIQYVAGDEVAGYRVASQVGALSGPDGSAEVLEDEERPDGTRSTYAASVPDSGPWQLSLARELALARTGSAPRAPAVHTLTYDATVTVGP